MSIFGPYIHNIDPVIGSLFGVYLWWYGLSYTLGFTNAHLYVRRHRRKLGLPLKRVYSLSILLALGVIAGGRFVEIAFYEWPFYSQHPKLIPAYWLGGMASHGLMLGGMLGVWIFCLIYKKPFLVITDALAIPAAFVLGVGRLGNFIDGQIVGSVTDVWWAVKFPNAEGFRHPVVLYDGIKNLLIIPVLAYARRFELPPGVVTGIFVFLYAFLRIFVDLYREYPTSLMGLATGQFLNIAFSVIGLALIVYPYWRKKQSVDDRPALPADDRVTNGVVIRFALLAAIAFFSLVIPSDATQDVPERYGSRHPGLTYSNIYPDVNPFFE
jgi:phosphatidylglycerol:prolipoprotein diacylglycerol transferase